VVIRTEHSAGVFGAVAREHTAQLHRHLLVPEALPARWLVCQRVRAAERVGWARHTAVKDVCLDGGAFEWWAFGP